MNEADRNKIIGLRVAHEEMGYIDEALLVVAARLKEIDSGSADQFVFLHKDFRKIMESLYEEASALYPGEHADG